MYCCSGHGSFSDSATLNSVVGHLLHSFILVPYHGWYAYIFFNSHLSLDACICLYSFLFFSFSLSFALFIYGRHQQRQLWVCTQ